MKQEGYLKEPKRGQAFEEMLKGYLYDSYSPGPAALDFPRGGALSTTHKNIKNQYEIMQRSLWGDAKKTENQDAKASLVSKYLRSTPMSPQKFKSLIQGGRVIRTKGFSMLHMGGTNKKNAIANVTLSELFHADGGQALASMYPNIAEPMGKGRSPAINKDLHGKRVQFKYTSDRVMLRPQHEDIVQSGDVETAKNY